MKQKTFLFERAMNLLGIAICGALCTYVAVIFGGMELLLAGVVMVMLCDGALTIWLQYKWFGLFLHLLWAGMFWGEVCHIKGFVDDTSCWQWYFLWGLLGLRVFILQPIYLFKLKGT